MTQRCNDLLSRGVRNDENGAIVIPVQVNATTIPRDARKGWSILSKLPPCLKWVFRAAALTPQAPSMVTSPISDNAPHNFRPSKVDEDGKSYSRSFLAPLSGRNISRMLPTRLPFPWDRRGNCAARPRAQAAPRPGQGEEKAAFSRYLYLRCKSSAFVDCASRISRIIFRQPSLVWRVATGRARSRRKRHNKPSGPN